MKIATAAYPADWFGEWADYEKKLTAWVTEAVGAGADLLVFPEYGAMELVSLAGEGVGMDLEASARAVSDLIPQADELHARLAAEHGVHILAGSGPVMTGERPVNRARFFGPEGMLGYQDKQIMTRYEREIWDVRPGDPLTLFDTPLGRIGILICYDSEFPLLGRALVDAGAEILLVPSQTERLSGYSRVRIGAMARALENQCVAVHSPTVGAVEWCEVLDTSTGAAAVYGPPDLGFPDTGVIAQGDLNVPGWVYADVDISAVARVRAEGRVFNHADWALQDAPSKNVKFG
ncbi:carbon-nitrogen hydrolase family protein [Pseudoruegeria sp. HB172150]|uniref:carbon-nitrogen hydrolase family protein n=1 Tax=Pseudoruegeria sp. HB172150 TaxID=2721164 RepID=UPI0015572710|nr:carbon-nitrogen hydrolase family protein [Pseudoruegeria sp. HB172150]